jgi:hypothetical protein
LGKKITNYVNDNYNLHTAEFFCAGCGADVSSKEKPWSTLAPAAAILITRQFLIDLNLETGNVASFVVCAWHIATG